LSQQLGTLDHLINIAVQTCFVWTLGVSKATGQSKLERAQSDINGSKVIMMELAVKTL
jgi:hypothetical protein